MFIDVPQAAASEISEQMRATVSNREHADRTYVGTVARTSHSLDRAAKTLTVEVDVPNSDESLLPGMYVETTFQADDARRPLRIPASALSFRSGGPQVAVVDKDSLIRFRDVNIARDLGDSVEIASGLMPDERVALNISNQLADGDKVTAHEVDEPSASPAVAPNKPGATLTASQADS